MLTIPALLPVYLAPGATDMRKSFLGLRGLVVSALRRDPNSGHVFAFCNKRRTMIKLLFWDGSGFWIACKRLDRGVFPSWPQPQSGLSEVVWTEQQLRWLLDGMDPSSFRQPRLRANPIESWQAGIPESSQAELDFEDPETMERWRIEFGLN
jgi:transposase